MQSLYWSWRWFQVPPWLPDSAVCSERLQPGKLQSVRLAPDPAGPRRRSRLKNAADTSSRSSHPTIQVQRSGNHRWSRSRRWPLCCVFDSAFGRFLLRVAPWRGPPSCGQHRLSGPQARPQSRLRSVGR